MYVKRGFVTPLYKEYCVRPVAFVLLQRGRLVNTLYTDVGEVAAKRRRTKISYVLNIKTVRCCFHLERVWPFKLRPNG